MLADKMMFLKLERLEQQYLLQRFYKVADVPVELCETKEYLRQEPSKGKWKKIKTEDKWGGSWTTGWFRADVKLPAACRGKKVFVQARTGGDSLFLVDKEYKGVFDMFHSVVMMTSKGDPTKRYHLSFERYSGHTYAGTQPCEDPTEVKENSRLFEGIEIVLEREDVTNFVFDLMALRQVMISLDDNSLRKFKIASALAEVLQTVDALPAETDERVWRPLLPKGRAIMRPLLEMKNSPTTPQVGLTGHSHIDTAWLWPLEETKRKCARTFSSMLNLMDQYPELRFIQSSPCQTEMVRKLYPSIFSGIKKRVAQGRWEPNGAMWVEPDLNVPSGESLARQFLVGQGTTRRHFGYTADTLWMPDVFGFSAALPQLMRLANVEYFCTAKLAWNDTNKFPYQTFIWQGIDGSKVHVHFNSMHCWPDPATLIAAWNGIQHKDVQDRQLVAYGFGDGGGGPQSEMVEVTRRMADLEGCPRTENMSVSRFMQGVRDELKNLPQWVGELYLENHRGTLTSISDIKRLNRRAEFALRDAELLSTIASLKGASYPSKEFAEIWEVLLTNQFHDILPGSSIPKVNDAAIVAFNECIAHADRLCEKALGALAKRNNSGKMLSVLNNLSWERSGEIMLDGVAAGLAPTDDNVRSQRVKDISGKERLVVAGLSIPSLGAASVALGKKAASTISNFRVKKNLVETPFAKISFDKSGQIVSWIDKQSGRQIVKDGGAFNQFLMGQDVPEAWDNWNITYDLLGMLKPVARLTKQSIAADGELQLRMEFEYELGRQSRIRQHVVFHSTTPQVDFETLLDWKEKHQFLKVGFDTSLLADFARFETQFGFLERPTHENTTFDRARFEFSVQKWADLSESNFGVAVLNDCKYGMSGKGGSLQLSLIKSGTHPDPRGDEGRHVFTYSILPHQGSFSVESVVRPAYELNTEALSVFASQPVAIEPVVSVDSPNVIVEAVKWAEDGKAFVVRLYEAGKTTTSAKVALPKMAKKVWLANLLEDKIEDLSLKGGEVGVQMHPFEVKTLVCGV